MSGRIKCEKVGEVLIVQFLQRTLRCCGQSPDGFPVVWPEIETLLKRKPKRILFDLSLVKSMGEEGLAMLIGPRKILGRQAVALCGAQGSVHERLHLTKMDDYFQMAATREEAIRLLNE